MQARVGVVGRRMHRVQQEAEAGELPMSDPLDEIRALLARTEPATPGPWDEKYVREAVRHIVRNCDFIDSEDENWPGWDRYADAGAIAALPELREACERLVRAVEEARKAMGGERHPNPNGLARIDAILRGER